MLISMGLTVDGGQKSGSGTTVRYAVGLAALLGEELVLTNIRAKRDKPGLRPQHLKAIEAVAEMCQGSLEGAKVGAREIRFTPGGEMKGGKYQWDIGTAGSTTMLAMALLPLACFAQRASTFRISGGLFQDFAPSAYHMGHGLFPLLRQMGVRVELEIVRPGYVPRGGGIIELKVEPVKEKLKAVRWLDQGQVRAIRGVALSSHLQERKVSQRMGEKCRQLLRARGYEVKIELIYDTSALQPGAALAIWAETDTGCIIGADRAGAPGRSSEEIGRDVARSLTEDLASGATVDRFLADQLLFYAALAQGTSQYLIPRMTEHVETNLWLVESLLGARGEVVGNRLTVQGVGFARG